MSLISQSARVLANDNGSKLLILRSVRVLANHRPFESLIPAIKTSHWNHEHSWAYYDWLMYFPTGAHPTEGAEDELSQPSPERQDRSDSRRIGHGASKPGAPQTSAKKAVDIVNQQDGIGNINPRGRSAFEGFHARAALRMTTQALMISRLPTMSANEDR